MFLCGLIGIVTREKCDDIRKRRRKREREKGGRGERGKAFVGEVLEGVRTDRLLSSSRNGDEVKKADDGAITRSENGAW